MAKVSVYNMDGKEVGTTELSDAVFGVEVNEHLVRELRRPRHAQRFPEAEESLGDRRAQVMPDRVQQEHHSGQAAEWYSHQFQEIIHSR